MPTESETHECRPGSKKFFPMEIVKIGEKEHYWQCTNCGFINLSREVSTNNELQSQTDI